MTDSAPHPNALAPVIVGLAGSSSMANDGVVSANRTSPREEVQWDHPGSMLSFTSGSAIKRITWAANSRATSRHTGQMRVGVNIQWFPRRSRHRYRTWAAKLLLAEQVLHVSLILHAD